MPKCSKYHAKWKANMAKCSRYHAKCKVTIPKCSKCQMPCKMTGSTSKLLQIQGKWNQERKQQKQQNLRQKQTPTILLSVFEHPGYTVWVEGSPFPCRFLVVSQDDPILQGLLSSISDACSLLCRSVTLKRRPV